MHGYCRFLAWRFDQAENLAAALVKPVAQILDAVFLLGSQVGGMGLGDRGAGQSFDVLMDIHKQWHRTRLLSRSGPAPRGQVGWLGADVGCAFTLADAPRAVVRENTTLACRGHYNLCLSRKNGRAGALRAGPPVFSSESFFKCRDSVAIALFPWPRWRSARAR